MKTLKKHFRSISFIMAISILFQSCKAYHNDSVTLEQASKEFKQSKIQTHTNETLNFRGIKKENNQYYGVKKVKNELVNIPLNEEFIKSVKLQNETLSTVLTIALPVVIIGAGLAIIAPSLSDWDSSGSSYLGY